MGTPEKRLVIAATIREQIAKWELENHNKQLENAQTIETYLKTKYTNEELYTWMKGQISTLYFQTYQLALDLAKKAERSLRLELGLENSNYIQADNWDNLRSGLLAGERLSLQLRQMERAYLDLNKREFEMTKSISLLQIDPGALLQLRASGKCSFKLEEDLFDMDGPGHYFRRIKTLSVSIPCVAGPYSSVNCTVTHRSSFIRTKAIGGAGYDKTENDPRFIKVTNTNRLSSIVTSSGQNDSGLFETNLRDERFLPFEGVGAIGDWELELPANPSKNEPQQFDYDTISDVILHVRYTARQGGDVLRTAAIQALTSKIEKAEAAGSMRLFSVRHEFPSEWIKFKSIKLGAEVKTATLALTLRDEHYPFWSQGRLTKVIEPVQVFAQTSKANLECFENADGTGKQDSLTHVKAEFGGLLMGSLTKLPLSTPVGPMTLHLSDNDVDDLWILVKWGK
jgi:hypothetical protein